MPSPGWHCQTMRPARHTKSKHASASRNATHQRAGGSASRGPESELVQFSPRVCQPGCSAPHRSEPLHKSDLPRPKTRACKR
eukprot:2882435-Rhodomonas_salina.2